jgi:hypothetical protein
MCLKLIFIKINWIYSGSIGAGTETGSGKHAPLSVFFLFFHIFSLAFVSRLR